MRGKKFLERKLIQTFTFDIGNNSFDFDLYILYKGM